MTKHNCYRTDQAHVANKVIPPFVIGVGVLFGSVLAIYIKKTTASHEPPSWFWILSFVGFFVALNWIFLLANEVVGLLQAIGQIFSISDAIMGLTVFALVSITANSYTCVCDD